MKLKSMVPFLLISISIFMICLQCQKSSLDIQPFGQVDGKDVFLYTLENDNGMRLEVINYGGTIVRWFVPDRDGNLADITLGFNTVEEYVEKSPYFGCLIGRFGNRIAEGKFFLNGKSYELPTNNFPADIPCHLHGGPKGFHTKVWDVEYIQDEPVQGLKFHYISEDGEAGYPGTLDVTVTYRLTNENKLIIDYKATTDQPTPINLTQHAYFNLKGEGEGDILDHVLMIDAGQIIPVNEGLIPTGAYRPVKNTPFDFTEPQAIGSRIHVEDEQLKFGEGYDHNWVLENQSGELALAATLYEPTSGRFMEVLTTEPGLQFYSGNFLDGTLVGNSNKPYPFRSGLCLESQHYPDSPNHPHFPSTILNPGEVYQTRTVYKFSVK
ncbi:galactose mutarotase [candidate division KSB1 bacterium]|nr:galactose mutarotase [candidate division KSB1 bacterium]